MLTVQENKHNLFLGRGQACLLAIMKDLSSLSSDSSSLVCVEASNWAHQQYPHGTCQVKRAGAMLQMLMLPCCAVSNKCLYL